MLPLWSSAQSLNKGSLHFDFKLQRNHSVTKPSYASQLCIAQPKHIQKQTVRGKKKSQTSNVLKLLLWSCSKCLNIALNILWPHEATQEGMEGSIFKNRCPAAPERASYTVLSTRLGKVWSRTSTLSAPHSSHTCPSPGQFSAHPSIPYQLYTPISSSPSSPSGHHPERDTTCLLHTLCDFKTHV